MAKKDKRERNTRAILNQAKYGTPHPELGIEIDTSDDRKTLKAANIRWSDIADIDMNLAKQSTRIANEILPIIECQPILDNLGDKKELFTKAAITFKNDFSKFLDELDALKEKWKGKSGQVLTMEDLQLYNIVSAEYNDLNTKFIQLAQLTSTTITVEGMEAAKKARMKIMDEKNNVEEGDFTEVDSKESVDGKQ